MNTQVISQASRRRRDHASEMTDTDGRHFQLQAYDLKNTRDLRTLLLDAAYELQAQPDFTDAHIHLYSCTLAKKRVEAEIDQFHRIALPHIARRIVIHDVRVAPQKEQTFGSDASFQANIHSRKPTAASQEAVLAYLLQRYIQSLPGVSTATIAAETGASLPTIYKVLNAYKHCLVKDSEDKTLRLQHFDQSDWFRWIQRINQLSSVYFFDRSGSPRNIKRLAKALAQLNREDLAIGGLLGAIHHLPALDATSAPQLDVLVHGTRRTDLSFITQMDPGLEQYDGRADMAHVAVHFIDRPMSLFMRQDAQNWGSLPDCIANLQKAGLTHQVNDALLLVRQLTA